jgi:hypothetical protein
MSKRAPIFTELLKNSLYYETESSEDEARKEVEQMFAEPLYTSKGQKVTLKVPYKHLKAESNGGSWINLQGEKDLDGRKISKKKSLRRRTTIKNIRKKSNI